MIPRMTPDELTAFDDAAREVALARRCEYHCVKGLFNRGGHLPCKECPACKQERERLDEMNRLWPPGGRG